MTASGDPAGPDEAPGGEREQDLDELVAALNERRATIDRFRAERDAARREAAAIRGRTVVRVAVGAANRARRARTAALAVEPRAAVGGAARRLPVIGRVLPPPAGSHRLRAGARADTALRTRLNAAAPDVGPISARVDAIVRSGGDPARRRAALAAIRSAHPDAAIVVLVRDATPAVARAGSRVRDRRGGQDHLDAGGVAGDGAGVVTIDGGTFADALRATDAAAPPDDRPRVVLFVHDDLEVPVPSALSRLVETLERMPDIAAVGGQLLLPRRRGPAVGPVSHAPDLTMAAAGLSVETVDGRPTPRPLGRGEAPRVPGDTEPVPVPLASAACLAVRRDALDPGRGNLDVDDAIAPALDVREGGGTVAIDEAAVFFHAEASEPPAADRPAPWSHRLARSVGLDRVAAAGRWSTETFHLAITVTVDDEEAGFGDWYTAHELGDAVERLGWRVSYLERRNGNWYDPPADLDAVIVLLDLYDITRLPPGVVRIAWARNWIDHWIQRPWFDDYDLVLTTSSASKAVVDQLTAQVARVFPLATNPDRFAPGDPVSDVGSDVAFVGSYFGKDRAIGQGLAAIDEHGLRVGLWGSGWEAVSGVAALSRGRLEYERLPDVYRSTLAVIDDANDGTTRDLGMLNARVFDALAAGVPVVTNNAVGAAELFGDAFPTWTDPEDLTVAVSRLVEDRDHARSVVERFRADVLEHHTYERRAATLRDLAADWFRAERWAIAIGPRTREAARSWGDTYFARAVQRQLIRRGRPTSVHVHREWADADGRADVVVHLFGARAPRPRPGPVSLLWVISHPDRIDRDACAGYDHVLVASDLFAEQLSATGPDAPVSALHQATDPDRFRPTPNAALPTELLFIGSSRAQGRPMVDAALASGHDLAVFGTGWTADLIDPAVVRGDWIENAAVAGWYSAAKIVLADHYDDMRELGFISNRIYDALASGAFVLSDDVAGLEAEFDGGAVGCATRAEAIAAIERFLADPAARADRAARGRQAVLARHTFAHRVDVLIDLVDPLARRRPSAVEPGQADATADAAAAAIDGGRAVAREAVSVARASHD